MSGARGTVTAFAWVLVSEPYQSLGLFEPYVLVLAAGGPSLDFPAIHPIFTRRSRVRGAFFVKPYTAFHHESLRKNLLSSVYARSYLLSK